MTKKEEREVLERQRNFSRAYLGQFLGGGMGSLAGVLAGRAIAGKELTDAITSGETGTVHPKAQLLFNKMVNDYNIKTPKLSLGAGQEPAYSPSLHAIKGDSFGSPAILGHETGHAIDYSKYQNLKSFARIGGPLVGAIGSAMMLTNDDTAPYAGIPAVAGMAPTLYQEGKASNLAIKTMRKMPETFSPEEISTAKRLLWKAGGTYGGATIGAGLGITAAGLILSHNNKSK